MPSKKHVIEVTMHKLFDKQLTNARRKLSEEVAGTSLAGNLISYKGITQVYTIGVLDYPTVIQEKDVPKQFHNSFNRVHRILTEEAEVAEALRYMSNVFDDSWEFVKYVTQVVAITEVPMEPTDITKAAIADYPDKYEILLRAEGVRSLCE